MSYTDRTLVCADCNAQFVFTVGEQEFHASKGFASDPRRCQDCRRARKADRDGGGGGGFSRGGYSSGGGQGGRREMFDVVCGQCGKDTQVPFQPNGSRPVYCSDCFSKQGSGSSRGGGGYNSYR